MSTPEPSRDNEGFNASLDDFDALEQAIKTLDSPHDDEALEHQLFVSEGAENMSYSSLCYMCVRIFRQWHSIITYFDQPKVYPGQRFRHWDHLFQLESSVERGCGVCDQLLKGRPKAAMLRELKVRTTKILDIDPKLIKGDLWIGSWRLPILDIEMYFSLQQKNLDVHHPADQDWNFRATLVPNLNEPHLDPISAISLNTTDALPLARQWFTKCRQSHKLCVPSEPHDTPERILSVRESPRLLLAAELQKTPEYATLSHCWGTAEFSVLKNDSIEAFRRCIPDEALTKTFKDAIEICRSLKIDFLWIDSLCIIQDDRKDWQTESAKMASIYGNSTLNIAADGARDGTAGCFLDRKSTWRSRFSTIVNGERVVYECVPNRSGYLPLLDDEPLRDRGWTVQEYLLPFRTIHFTSTQVVWNCIENTACETFPNNEIHDMNLGTQTPVLAFECWFQIVNEFSKCLLTNYSDKLEAISGIARHIQRETKDEYVAGLWRKDLEKQLCWFSCEGVGRSQVVPGYRAPSWSWASTDAEVRDFSNLDEYASLVKITQVETVPLGENLLGQLSRGHLRLYCQRLHPTHTDNTVDDLSDKEMGLERDERREIFIRYDYAGGYIGLVYILVVAQEVKPDSDFHVFRGLVLVRTNMAQGQYRRVGMFMSWYYRKIRDPMLKQQIQDTACWDDALAFIHVQDLEDGTKQGLIEIV